MFGETEAVFLSYASEDAGVAARIADALKAGDIEVWFDQSELDDRGSRGEHVPACAPLAINVGLADRAAVCSALRAPATRPAQKPVVRAVLPPFLSGLRRTDPEIDRAFLELFQ